MAARAEAIRAEGAVAACQLVHLGRETTGAETWYHPVAPSPVRSPREPTRPRSLADDEVDAIVEGFRVSAVNAVEAGFQVVELHAAHGYLLAQVLSAVTNPRCLVPFRAARAAGADRRGDPRVGARGPHRHPAVGRGRRGGRAHTRRAVRAAAARERDSPTT